MYVPVTLIAPYMPQFTRLLQLRAALVLLPTLPPYLFARLARHLPLATDSRTSRTVKALPSIFELLGEINLAAFYIAGSYYGLASRLLRTRHVRLFIFQS